jgi:hypothetical protein
MRIALASDACPPQINGVVRPLKATAATLSPLHRRWRGADLERFHPRARPRDDLAHRPRPVMTCVGRLAIEKNLRLPLAGTKVLIGDGPQAAALGCHRAGGHGRVRADLGEAIAGALRLDRHVCAARARTFSWEAATSQLLAALAPIPPPLRARVALSRSSAMIGRIAARRQTMSQAGEAN